ncbi:hypothetical protein QVD17_27391 [Tagetes erecta]|uniref:Uncharacterized protein n=1 Tax=Tagetes erecta TaxID=13708 RepID=A0AAD8NRK1_TARER|nr:hypothetical protein QVD17_27391 [Tagetes erecta]
MFVLIREHFKLVAVDIRGGKFMAYYVLIGSPMNPVHPKREYEAKLVHRKRVISTTNPKSRRRISFPEVAVREDDMMVIAEEVD